MLIDNILLNQTEPNRVGVLRSIIIIIIIINSTRFGLILPLKQLKKKISFDNNLNF